MAILKMTPSETPPTEPADVVGVFNMTGVQIDNQDELGGKFSVVHYEPTGLCMLVLGSEPEPGEWLVKASCPSSAPQEFTVVIPPQIADEAEPGMISLEVEGEDDDDVPEDRS